MAELRYVMTTIGSNDVKTHIPVGQYNETVKDLVAHCNKEIDTLRATIIKQEDKLHRRNMQIKDLRERLEDSIDRTKLSETLNFYLQDMELEDKIMESVL